MTGKGFRSSWEAKRQKLFFDQAAKLFAKLYLCGGKNAGIRSGDKLQHSFRITFARDIAAVLAVT